MRQIGTRDEARLIGGVGCCGRGENCSSSFLKDLRSVSVRAAKEQNLDLSPNRLSGMCGRLKRCLNYEIQGGGGGVAAASPVTQGVVSSSYLPACTLSLVSAFPLSLFAHFWKCSTFPEVGFISVNSWQTSRASWKEWSFSRVRMSFS